MFTERNKRTCRLFLQTVFNEGRLAMLPGFVAPGAVHHDLGLDEDETHRGLAPFSEVLDLYRYAFPDLQVEIEDMVAEGDRVVTRLILTGTQKRRLMGVAASGRKVRISGMRIDRFSEGAIVESWFHWDTLGLLTQIGALPALERRPAPASSGAAQAARRAYAPRLQPAPAGAAVETPLFAAP